MRYFHFIWLSAAALLTTWGDSGASAGPGPHSTLPIRGIVRPISQAAIAIDSPMRVSKIYFREAQSFKKGDKLVAFDCERLTAEHAAAVAVYREMQFGLDRQTYIDKRGAVGKLDVQISQARTDKARAEAAALAARLKQCSIVAPFDGRITELKVNEHEIPASGQPFISIVDETKFEIDLIVPSVWLRSIAAGTPFRFTVDETGRSHDAKVLRIGAAVDPVSQTVKLIAEFVALDGRVLSGMSGSAVFPGQESAR